MLFCVLKKCNGVSSNYFFDNINHAVYFINKSKSDIRESKYDYLSFTFHKININSYDTCPTLTILYTCSKIEYNPIFKTKINNNGVYINDESSTLKIDEELTIKTLNNIFNDNCFCVE